MNDSDVGLQPPLLHVSLVTQRARIPGVVVNLAFDSLVNVLLVCFQTVKVGKVTPTDLTGDDYTALVDFYVCLVVTGLKKTLPTYFAGVFVHGLTLVFNCDMRLE